MKTKRCANIINSKQCESFTTHYHAKVCKPCAKELHRIKGKEYYHANKKIWQPYIRNCKLKSCNKIIEINNQNQSRKLYCNNKCRYKHRALNYKKNPNKTDNEEYKLTPCICPGCGKKHELELYWTGKLPARKYCKGGCDYSLAYANIDDPVVGGYTVGVY